MVIKLQAGAFYGATRKSVSVAGFRFTEKSYAPQSALPRHAHELAHFCFVLSGNYTENLRSRSEERAPANLIFYPPDMTHAEAHHSRGRHFLVELEPWRADSLRDYGLPISDPAAFAGGSTIWLGTKLYREFSQMDALSTLALESMALELMVETLRDRENRKARRAPKWLADVKQILRANFANPPTLTQLSQAVGIHPVHLVRVFRTFQHCTMSEYVRQLRVESARQQIMSSDASLVEIALSSGFADHTHFSRSFKRVTGMTPSDFRSLIRRS